MKRLASYCAELPELRAVAPDQAGASSMWASCCGLLNEVMGTGVVRGQQPGFGAGAGPFRFAPNAGYSTYPPPSSGNTSLVCKACGVDFSVFRKKHVCCDCKKNFCSLCSALQENLRRCYTCNVLKETTFQRPQLMRLKVRDLRQYLMLRNVSTETCREKEDLVDLVLFHHGADAEDNLDTSSIRSSRSVLATPHSILQSAPSQSSLSASPGDLLSRRGSSGTANQEHGDGASLLNLESNENVEPQATLLSRKRARASLSDISTMEDIEGLNVRQLKEILARYFVNYSGCCEKWELVERVNRLYRETEENRKSLENVENGKTAVVMSHPQPICSGGNGDGEKMHSSSDDNLCRICMDAAIDCVLLECGHMVTCTKCGKRMSECPICRQYVVRAVHVFKS